jgi:hypothetical protein
MVRLWFEVVVGWFGNVLFARKPIKLGKSDDL